MVREIRLLGSSRFWNLYAGPLCTIDVANDPLVVYESLMDLRPPRIDFLLPHATWGHSLARSAATDDDYAQCLIAIFDRWLADGCPSRIRTFDSTLSTLRGRGELHRGPGPGLGRPGGYRDRRQSRMASE